MTKDEFVRARTTILSVMLDNPDENGIYSTTAAFASLDDLYDQITGCTELSGAQKIVKGLPYERN